MTSTVLTERLGREKLTRPEILAALVARDGTKCQYPDCGKELDFELDPVFAGPREVTIDHWMPQVWCKEQGWTYEQIWDLTNLKLMHKSCNAKKGDRLPDENGQLPERIVRQFRYRRQKRANRPDEPCDVCDNGHNLEIGEVCAQCNCNAQRFPRSAKMNAADCDHELFWCAWCSIGVIERPSAMSMAVRQGVSGEWEDAES